MMEKDALLQQNGKWGNGRLLALLVIFLFSSSSRSLRVTRWEAIPGQNVTSAEASCPAVSVLACARLCKGYSHCVSFAFDRSAGMCHLHPVIARAGNGLSADTESTLRAFSDIDPACKDGPSAVPHLLPIQWTRTLTSADANVTCQSDYMLNKKDVVARCTSDGQLTPADAQCLQRIWRNPVGDIRIPLPLTVAPGWSVCVSGTPVGSFGIDIEAGNSSNVPVNTAWTFAAALLPGSFEIADVFLGLFTSYGSLPNPLSLNVAAVIKFSFTAASQIAILVNNVSVYTSAKAFALNAFSHVVLRGNITVSYVDLWCVQ